MNDNDQSRTPLPPAVVSELKEIMEGFKEKFGDSILIQVGKLTEEHVGWGIQFGHDAGLIITDVGPGYEGNVKVGLHGYESGHFVTELHPDKFVTITPKDAA